MARHAYYEELCALAPLGELTPSQLHELDEHIAECETCREAAIGYNRFFQRVVPAVTRSDEVYIESRRDDMRAAVMQSVAAIDQERDRESIATGHDTDPLPSLVRPVPRNRFHPFLWGSLGTASLAVITFWAGAHFHGRLQPEQMRNADLIIETVSAPPKPASTQPVVITKASGNSNDNQLKNELDEERERNAKLARKLSVEDTKLAEAIAAQEALHSQIDRQAQALVATKTDLDARTAALAEVHSSNSNDATTIAALEGHVHDLTDKLNTQSSSLDRGRDLLSHGREIRDIIGARNLHIIDVYDTNTGGTTRRPFARAFYTEGKSLVYYAYDLPQRRVDEGKFSYVAWGQSNGSKASIRKIGILSHDDQTQHRWSLDFSNPQILKEIDSVFITMERSDEDIAQPKGKRLLTAYLGTAPNHP